MTVPLRPAEENRLVETIPDQLVEQWCESAVTALRFVVGGIFAMGIPLAAAIVWLCVSSQSHTAQLLVTVTATLVMGGLWIVGVHALGGFVRSGWSRENLPIVELIDDNLTLTWRREVIKAKICECNLRIGRAWQMKYAARKAGGLVPFGDRDLFLIDFPPLRKDVLGCTRSYTTAAVGYTDASMQMWSAALGIEIEPHRHQ